MIKIIVVFPEEKLRIISLHYPADLKVFNRCYS